jgi:hypothetical protein
VVIPGAFSDVEHAKPPHFAEHWRMPCFYYQTCDKNVFVELLGRPNVWSGHLNAAVRPNSL